MSAITLNDIARLVGGRVAGVGNPQIVDALPLQDAYAGCLTLADKPQQLARLAACGAAAVMLAEELTDCPIPMLVVAQPHKAFASAIEFLRAPHVEAAQPPGVHPTAQIHPTAHIGDAASIAAGVSVGEGCRLGTGCSLHPGVQLMPYCQLGDHCEIFPNAVLYPHTRVGHRVLIHAGAVLGAYGFGYRPQDGRHVRTAQLGWVELEDDVEIGAATTIDRGTFGPTRIGQGTKIDNQVQVGHNCHIGRHNLICAQVGIAGSTSTGDRVVLAGQVGIADHVHLADDVTIGAQAGIMGNVEAGAVLVGSPAAPRRQRMLEWALIAKLPEMRKELRAMQEQMLQLQQQLADQDPTEKAQRRAAA